MKDLKEAVCADLAKRLRFAELSIAHCLDQLPDADVWWRPAEGQNSVGNLVLHVCGAMRQLIVAGVGGAADDRQRQAEFAERGPIETDLLKRRVAETVAASREVIERAASSDLLATRRRAQGTSTTVLSDLLTAAYHSSEHAAQIVYLPTCVWETATGRHTERRRRSLDRPARAQAAPLLVALTPRPASGLLAGS